MNAKIIPADYPWGLPNHVFVSKESGKIDESTFRRSVGITNRNHSNRALDFIKSIQTPKQLAIKKLTRGEHPLIDFYASPHVRMKLLMLAFDECINKRKEVEPISQLRFAAPSWDFKVFCAYAQDILTDPGTYHGSLEGSPWISDAILELNNKDPKLMRLFQAASRILERANLDLAQHWQDKSEAERELLVSVFMALSSLYGTVFLQSFCRLHPEIAGYFSECIERGLLQFDKTCSPATPEATTEGTILSDSSLAETSPPKELWEARLHAATAHFVAHPGDPVSAKTLIDLITQYHDWVIGQAGTVEAEAAVVALSTLVGKALSAYGIDLFIPDKDGTAYPSLLNQWQSWAHRPATEIATFSHQEWIAHWNEATVRVMSARSRFADLQIALEAIQKDAAESTMALVARRLKQMESDASAALQSAKKQLIADEDSLIQAALPSGTDMAALEQDTPIRPTPDGWPSDNLLTHLRGMLNHLQQSSTQAFDICEDQAVLPTSPSPQASLPTHVDVTKPVDDQTPTDPVADCDQGIVLPSLDQEELSSLETLPDVIDEPSADEADHDIPGPEHRLDPSAVLAEESSHPPAQVNPVKISEPLHIQADTEEGCACLEHLLTDVFVPGEHTNAAITHLVAQRDLPKAAQIAYVMEAAGLSDDFLSYRLIKAAYYGMNTYNRVSFDKARRQLLSLQKAELEEWQEQPGGELVPYLLFLAAFQPALFGGNMSTAAIFLREMPESLFDHQTRGLVNDIIDMANRGEPVTAAHLKPAETGKGAREVQKFNPQSLIHWQQKIREARRGYAPVLKALTYCLDQGLFHKVTSIIVADERQKHSIVENFVATYQEKEASTLLLNDLLTAINMAPGEGITRIGKERFHHKVAELVYIAQDWLETAVQVKGSVLEDFNKRFHTRLNHATTYFQGVAQDEQQSGGRRAGAGIVAHSLQLLKERLAHPDKIWPYSRIKGWYYLPRDVATLHLPDAEESSQAAAQWLLERMDTNLCTRQTLTLALERQKLRLVELLKLHLQDAGDPVADIDTHALFQALQQSLGEQGRSLQAKLENALLAALIDSARAELLSGQLADSMDVIEQLTILDDVDDIRLHFQEIDQELKERMISIKRELRQRCDAGMQALLEAVPVDPVPAEWERNLEQAFASDNIPVVWEMLDELVTAAANGRRIEFATIKNVSVLPDFMAQEETIYQGVITALREGKNGIRHAASQHPQDSFGLHFGAISTHFKRSMDALSNWHNSKPKTSIDQEMYLDLCAILQVLGINRSELQFNAQLKTNIRYQTATGFASLRIPIAFSQSTRPFAIFGDKIRSGGHLQIMIAYLPWQPQNLSELTASHNIHEDALLISAVPLSPSQRQEFAHYFKRKQQTVLHVDLVTLLFLAAQEQSSIENIAVRNFLWLSAPYTYFNPYGGDTLRPPLPEMRYGREKQVQLLLRMDGAAIVYGGRQLGKSTILQEVQLRFNHPEQHKYAFYEMLDKDLHRRLDVSKAAHEKARSTIWFSMYNNLVGAGLIKRTNITPSVDECIRMVKQTIIDDKKSSFIVIFDEIDPILNVDSNHDFSIFRGLRDLVANHAVAGRFKVIIGGLENVKRFENSPNYPLTQMGSTIKVEIMPTQEAIHLVTEPMLAAGYRFADVQAVNHILAITNRHPGLIQAFCSELINYLSANRNQRIGTCTITDADVESIGRKPEVSDLIRKRFDMTLNLDDRYLVIIYGIIDDGRGAQPFSVEYAKGVAEVWLPEAFRSLSKHQFEAFLDELIGLGVLRKNDDGRYALRNTNVLKLLVDIKENDVGHRLEMAIRNYNNYDPLDRHAYDPKRHEAPSPITYRDERTVIGVSVDRDSAMLDSLPGRTPASRYTTTLVIGSQAQGIAQLENTLPSIYEEEDIRRFSGNGDQQTYVVTTVQSGQFNNPAEFEKRLLSPLVTAKSKRAPQMAFVHVKAGTTIANLLGLIDAAHGFADQCVEGHYPVRILFLLDPAAYWHWLSHAELTRNRESLQAFIKLTNWSGGAISALLGRIGMNDTNDVVEKLLDTCQGWYHPLYVIASTRKQNPGWMDIEQFTNFQLLSALNQKASEKFLKLTGIDDVPWVRPLLALLAKVGEASIDVDLFMLYAEESGMKAMDDNAAKTCLRWLIDMGMLVDNRQPGRQLKGQQYALAPAIAHALRMTAAHDVA